MSDFIKPSMPGIVSTSTLKINRFEAGKFDVKGETKNFLKPMMNFFTANKDITPIELQQEISDYKISADAYKQMIQGPCGSRFNSIG